jgi:inhibitor of cysteine peptidase
MAAWSGPSRELTPDDDGTAITLRVGESITLALPANASTGYGWSVREQDEAALRTTATTYAPSSDLPGAGGTDRRTLRAERSGDTRLRLVYCRPWDCDRSTAATFDLRVRVRGANDCGCPDE